ncbi:glycosyltransferase family 4 protein [Flavobacterium sp. 3-218]
MKVLIFNTLYYPNNIGGAEKSVQSLAENLLNSGIQVTVVSSTSKKDYINYVNGVKVCYINNENIYWGFDQKNESALKKVIWHTLDIYNFRLEKKIIKILETEKPEIIHTNNLSSFSVIVWSIAKRRGIRTIHTLRDYYLACPSAVMYKNGNNCLNQCFSCKFFSLVKKKLSVSVNSVVGISNYILQKHLELGYFKNVDNKAVIGNDVSVPRVNKKKLFCKTKIVFGFIGQLNESKGIIQLLKTFKNFESFNNWKLLIAGKGNVDFTNSIKEEFGSDRIDFVGVVDSEMFYNEIDVLIVPSLWQEPFGRVVIEGIQNAKYVLASKRGGISELLIEDDLYEPNSNELFEKIESILRTSIIPEQRNKFRGDTISKYLSLYQKMLAL